MYFSAMGTYTITNSSQQRKKAPSLLKKQEIFQIWVHLSRCQADDNHIVIVSRLAAGTTVAYAARIHPTHCTFMLIH